jgi:hypothetical protein
MIVRTRRWRNWQGKKNGCAVLDLVSAVNVHTFLRISWPDTGVLRLQSYGGEECWVRSYHMPVWNVSQPNLGIRTRRNLTGTIGIFAIDVGRISQKD